MRHYFVDRKGRELFAADPLIANDTWILVEYCWAYAHGKKVCDLAHCPADQASYCLECHMAAAEARDIVCIRQTGKAWEPTRRPDRPSTRSGRAATPSRR